MKALVSTIEPIDGGVPSMAKWVCDSLASINIEPIVAWYSPWSIHPKLSVPLYKLLSRVPSKTRRLVFNKYNGFGMGAWLPELEFTHYLPTKSWKELIEGCDLHLVVSGNTLAATPFVLYGVPFFGWIATPWEADREHRIAKYSPQRKFIDHCIIKPVVRRLEKKILKSEYGSFLTLSAYTGRELEKISSRNIRGSMIPPINRDVYCAITERTIHWRIGFSGRYCDPRKNATLLLEAIKIVSQDEDIELILVGDKNPGELDRLIFEYKLEDRVRCYSHMDPPDLSALLQTFDVFVIPSHQEGLCIAALEAMACGVPIISTYCGGPEEFVIPGQTGELVQSNPRDLASAIQGICSNRNKRTRLSNGALEWINSHATEKQSTVIFRKHLMALADERGLQTFFNEECP